MNEKDLIFTCADIELFSSYPMANGRNRTMLFCGCSFNFNQSFRENKKIYSGKTFPKNTTRVAKKEFEDISGCDIGDM